jgi:cardiolipin synthase
MTVTKNGVFRGSFTGLLLAFCFSQSAIADPLSYSDRATTGKPSSASYAVGPDSNFDLLLKTLDSAQKKLLINIYQFENSVIADHLIARIKSGVTVEILLETEPCCTRRMGEEGKAVLRKIHSAMKASGNKNHKIFLMGSKLVASQTPFKRRFTYNHAKYLIADNHLVHMSSENFTETGHPVPGLIGNRGWDIAIENNSLVQKMNALFTEDTDLSFKDVLLIKPEKDGLPAWANYSPTQETPAAATAQTPAQRKNQNIKFETGNISQAELIVAPDSIADMKTFMDRANNTLNIQFMSLPSTWGRQSTLRINPIVEKAIEAASRGVKVRVLLNDERVFVDTSADPQVAKGNEKTAALLERIAECKKIDIAAKIIDIEATGIRYIHNKGILVDSDQVLVSSINGTENSVKNNRETALAITSTDTSAYFTKIFDYDWNLTSQSYSDSKINIAKSQLIGCPSVPAETNQSPTNLLSSGLGFFFN